VFLSSSALWAKGESLSFDGDNGNNELLKEETVMEKMLDMEPLITN
jgi:hypothetical protein